MVNCCLGLRRIDESHTGEYIAEQIENTLREKYRIDLNIPEERSLVVGNTTDTAANEKKAGFENFDYILKIIRKIIYY